MRKWRLMVTAGLAVLAMGGVAAAAEQVAQKALTPVRYEEVIRSIFYLPSYVALTKGYFKDEGLDVSMKTSWGSDKGTAALLAGTADIVLVGPETSIYIKNGESPDKVKIFAGLTASDGSMLIGRKKVENFDWKSLKGAKILSWRTGSAPDLFIQRILRSNGLDPQKDVDLISNLAAPARQGAFVAGTAEYGTFFEPDVSAMEKAGQAVYLASVGKAVGEIDYTVFIATDSYIKKNPQVIQSWTNALYRAQKFALTADPVEVAKAVAPFFTGVDFDLIVNSVKRYRDLGMLKRDPLTRPEAIQRLQDLLVEGKLLKVEQRVKYEDVVVTDFARKAIETIK